MGVGAKSDDLLPRERPPRKETAVPGKAPNNSKRKNRIPAPLLV